MQTGSSETLIGWKSGKETLCPSIGPNGGSVAMYSGIALNISSSYCSFAFIKKHLVSSLQRQSAIKEKTRAVLSVPSVPVRAETPAAAKKSTSIQQRQG
jgi:hypothetical protein